MSAIQNSLPIVLVPGLLCSARLYAHQVQELWRMGPVMVADQTRDSVMAGIARRILIHAPPRFALVGLSMGGYIAFEIMRQEPDRVAKLALLDTSARADTPEQTLRRKSLITLARSGPMATIADRLFPILVHPSRRTDEQMQEVVRRMALETGPEAFIRQQTAIISRVDSRSGLGAIKCPGLVMVGDADELTPPELSAEIAGSIPGARLVTVAECGHLSTLEQPRFVSGTLLDWLRGTL